MRWFLRLLAVAAAVIAVIVIYNTYFEDPIKYRRRKYLVVLGGGVTPTGGIPHWVKQRACRAEKLFIKSNKMNTVVTLSRGTPHKPNPLNSDGCVPRVDGCRRVSSPPFCSSAPHSAGSPCTSPRPPPCTCWR